MEEITDTVVHEVIQIMNETYGKDLTIYDQVFLSKSIERRIVAGNVKKLDYGSYLVKNSNEADQLMASFNITYTQFFRNSLTFSLLEHLILPRLLNQKPEGTEIRIWSAGCSTGQEAYSIGILLEEMLTTASKSMRFRIFATDLSSEVLVLAREGIYDEDGISNLKIKYLKKYFIKNGEMYRVKHQLKQNIDFLRYDLLDQYSINPPESIFGDFDIIFCSNLLFYYQIDIRRTIVKKLKRSLSAQGYLISGEAESRFIGKDAELKMISPNSTIFQSY